MATEYTIYLVNQSAITQQFWCFLGRPSELAADPGVFANSSTSLAVAPHSESINTFTIPVQYVVGAGAGNNPVGLDIRISSNITKNTDLGKKWDAGYATVPPNLGPTLAASQTDKSPPGTIAIRSNEFNRAHNEANGWFSNMSYGIKTAQGFIGMTWSPSPQDTRTLTPLLKFYVATGSFGQNTLASWTEVSNGNAEISVPNDFEYNNTTVTLTATGNWLVTRGKPNVALLRRTRGLDGLIHTHKILAEAHAGLISAQAALPAPVQAHLPDKTRGRVDADGAQSDEVASVVWDPASADADTLLSGTLSVTTAVTAAFSVFVLAGVTFSIRSILPGGLQFRFTYSGPRSVQNIKELLVAGAQIFLS